MHRGCNEHHADPALSCGSTEVSVHGFHLRDGSANVESSLMPEQKSHVHAGQIHMGRGDGIVICDQPAGDSSTGSVESMEWQRHLQVVEEERQFTRGLTPQRRILDSSAVKCHVECSHYSHGHSDRNRYDSDVGHDKTDNDTLVPAKSCVMYANETARPDATEINNSSTEVCLKTVYCRGIFTDDEDDDEVMFAKPSVDSHTEPGVSLDNNLDHYQRYTVNVIGNARDSFVTETQQFQTSYNGNNPVCSTVTARETPPVDIGTVSSFQSEALEASDATIRSSGVSQPGALRANESTIRTVHSTDIEGAKN